MRNGFFDDLHADSGVRLDVGGGAELADGDEDHGAVLEWLRERAVELWSFRWGIRIRVEG